MSNFLALLIGVTMLLSGICLGAVRWPPRAWIQWVTGLLVIDGAA
jgi:hypothetical protein